MALSGQFPSIGVSVCAVEMFQAKTLLGGQLLQWKVWTLSRGNMKRPESHKIKVENHCGRKRDFMENNPSKCNWGRSNLDPKPRRSVLECTI